jgi:hypothetical protein
MKSQGFFRNFLWQKIERVQKAVQCLCEIAMQ